MDVLWVLILVGLAALHLWVLWAVIRSAVLSALRFHTMNSTQAVSLVSSVPVPVVQVTQGPGLDTETRTVGG